MKFFIPMLLESSSFQFPVSSKKVAKCAKVPKVLKLATLLRKHPSKNTFAHFTDFFNWPLVTGYWLLVLIMVFLNVGCEKEKPLPDMLHLEIDTHNARPLRQALYGFNTNMITGDYGYLDPDFC